MTSEIVDQFIDRIYELSVSNITRTKGTDVILLMGGTGSGKSTFLNMVAGSTLTASRQRGKWIINANPCVAITGHTISQTFSPNYWEGNGRKFFDCPGLNDTRGIQEEIVKSFFIKELADNARSFKIILIGDIHALHGGRCLPFELYFKQLRQFLPNFNQVTDCSIIITKATSDLSLEDVINQFDDCIAKKMDPNRISIVYEPKNKGIVDYSYLEFEEIFNRAPSISSKCNLPLSTQAKLALIDIAKNLNNSISSWARQFSSAVRTYYYQIISSKLETSGQQFNKIHQKFEQIKQLSGTCTPMEFLYFIKVYSEKLNKLCSTGFNFPQLLSYLEKKIHQIKFLKEKIQDFQYYVENWVQCLSVNFASFKKGNNTAKFKSFDTFAVFLQRIANLDINKPIQTQIHQYLNIGKQIKARYSGSKQIDVELQKASKCQKTIIKSFVVSALFEKEVPYSGYAKYSDTKTVTGSVTVESCCCGNSLVRRCWACSHYDKSIKYSTDVKCEGSVRYEKTVPYSHEQNVLSEVTINASKDFLVKKQAKQTVKYEGSHDASCNQHHRCSCQSLSEIAFNAKQLLQDLICYNQINTAQQQEISLYRAFVKSDCTSFMGIAQQFTIQHCRISNRQMTLKEYTDKIHSTLSQDHFINAPYSDTKQVKIQKPYCQNIRLKGSQPTKTKISHSKQIPYSGTQSYSIYEAYSGSVECWTCYCNCSWCNTSSYQQRYNGSVHFSGNAYYSGKTTFSDEKEVRKDVQYDQQVPCAGIIEKLVTVNYNGYNQVCCDKGASAGSGHHDCSSCKMWEKYVNAFKKLLDVKSQIISKIEDNMRILKQITNKEN